MDNLVFLVPIAGMATGGLMMVVVYKLVSKWMDYRHRGVAAGVSDEELQGLRDDLALVRDLPDRVAELEERLDFTERLLAQARQDGHAPLGPGER